MAKHTHHLKIVKSRDGFRLKCDFCRDTFAYARDDKFIIESSHSRDKHTNGLRSDDLRTLADVMDGKVTLEQLRGLYDIVPAADRHTR
jgi:hypothetical protein